MDTKEYMEKFNAAQEKARAWEKNHSGWKGIPIMCNFCGEFHMCKVPENEYNEFAKNPDKNIQDILYNVSAEDREMFISGMCPKCWDKTIGNGKDEEDEEEYEEEINEFTADKELDDDLPF